MVEFCVIMHYTQCSGMTSYQNDPRGWQPPSRPAELTESRLIEAFLNGRFSIDSHLPPERELAVQLGVTRPTLREALQRLARDGWVEIRQGRPTRIRNFWVEGTMGVLSAIARSQTLPDDFVPNLLALRLVLAPAYARAAVEHHPDSVSARMGAFAHIPDTLDAFARADWEVHVLLCVASENLVFTLILNGFQEIYQRMATSYFSVPELRAHSRAYYAALSAVAHKRDANAAERVTHHVMKRSQEAWDHLPRDGRH